MQERKKHVIKKAYELFIDKGYQATSIQDILDESGISKGTFYNYFPSKSELFKAVFTSIGEKLERDREQLLLGENLADIEIFIKQIDLGIQTNINTRLFALVEEVFFSNDSDLKQFIKDSQFKQISWVFHRLIDLFGEEKRPYLLDCAVLFMGMLHNMFRYHRMANEVSGKHTVIIRYCVERLQMLVEDVSRSGVQLLKPQLIHKWVSEQPNQDKHFLNEIFRALPDLRKSIEKLSLKEEKQSKYLQIVDFIQEELTNNIAPRYFLIEGSLLSLENCPEIVKTTEFDKCRTLLWGHILKRA